MRFNSARRCGGLRPDIAFGADIIAGFPTETEEMFARSKDLVEACGLTFLHVFPYSPRPGTPAARMPQVSGEVIKQRAKRLRATGEAALQRRLASEIGATRQVLIESATQGRTEHFMPVAIAGETPGTVRTLCDHRARWRAVDGCELLLSCPGQAGLDAYGSLPVPSAGPEPFVQMGWRGGQHAHRVLVPRNRDHDLAGMQMQARLAEARSVAINIVADNRPAHGGGVNAQLMGAAGDRFQREPAQAIAAPQYFPVGDRRLAVGIGLLPTSRARH